MIPKPGSKNPNGIFQGIIYDNEKPISGFRMNNISYDDTKGINAHIDYPTHAKGGPYYQLLFRMPGYQHSIYRENKNGGRIHLEDGKTHLIRIELKDAHGNTSNLKFQVRYKPKWEKKILKKGKMFYPGMVDGFEAPGCSLLSGRKKFV